ncbi:MlaC/ttg2D family ABC transporter substrate-binding protein [Desulfurivibrio alkaliphilus]|uniref:Toluene tolerance family protein n=1 Tax=Desulfurivibrio alkaliphilus (strain DSM 19089 / UNIQEM U267 / AHT2) TaxID=589865 RepID=D6Z366_DESAT|nr:ABC transporter substrate-binding protein [Desulfurivibrio alkaliphilus]ADH85991.1 toluene tolerance family protein [Desulfurivibrio alkaliphilus AHT 2]
MQSDKTFLPAGMALAGGRWLLPAALMLIMALAPWGVAAAEPRDTVTQAVDEIIDVLTDPELAGTENRQSRYDKVVALVERFFDFEEISMRALGPRWRELSTEQRQLFIGLFKQYLENNYVDQVDRYSGEKVVVGEQEIREDRRGNRFARVATDFIMRDQAVPVHYRMREKDGRWVVYDVDIEGVSLVRNFRSQFDPYPFEELIRRMEESIASGRELDGQS